MKRHSNSWWLERSKRSGGSLPPAQRNGTTHGKPNPNRRRDEALKLLHKGGELVRETIAQGKRRAERFYILISGKRYAVRKKIAGLLLAQRGVLEMIAKGAIARWVMTFLGKSWTEATL